MKLENNSLFRDVLNDLVGKEVVVHTASPETMSGILRECNGYLLAIENDVYGTVTYIPSDKIIAIGEVL